MNIVLDLYAPMFCILLCIGSGIGWLLWKQHKWQIRYWLIPMFLCYALLVIKLTVFPIYIFDKESLDRTMENVGKYLAFYQLIPFASIKNYFHGSGIVQLAGNIVLLSPLAVFIEIFLQQRPKAWKVALGVSAASLLIEITQLVINLSTRYPIRVPDVDDLILNIAGVVITIILTRVIGKNQKIRKVLQKIFYH